MEARLVGDNGVVLPHDGTAVGEVEVRGPWVTGAYYKDDDPGKFHDGWLRTGDVGTIDPLGFVTLTDRAKDGSSPAGVDLLHGAENPHGAPGRWRRR